MKKMYSVFLATAIAASVLPQSVMADNPLVQTRYTADPAPLVSTDGETMYLFTSHDEPEGGENGAMYVMNDWNLYSTNDMVNWTDLGVVASYKIFEWSKGDAWAIQTIEKDGKYYMFAPVTGQTWGAIGVAVADRIEGPYTDLIGAPLVEEFGMIDPSVFVDTDKNGEEHIYLYCGNPTPHYGELTEDMKSFKDGLKPIEKTVESFGSSTNADRETRYEEGPWFYKRDGKYYLVYAGNGIPEDLEYSTAEYPDGPWKYGGVIMPTFDSGTFTNHPGIVDYKGHSYLFYHTAKLPGSGGFRRSVAVEEFEYDENGIIPEIQPTTTGPKPLRTLNPYERVESETIAFSEGLKSAEYYTDTTTGEITDTFTNDDTKHVYITGIENNDYIKVRNVDFAEGAGVITASVACAENGGEIELRLDSKDGELVGTIPVSYTGGSDVWQEKAAAVNGAKGTHDLYLVFKGGTFDENIFNFDYYRFSEKTEEKTLTALNAIIDDYKIDIKENINTTNMVVKAIYSDGSEEDVTDKVAVTSDLSNITYDNGVVTASAYGNSTLTVSYEGVSENIKLDVKDMDTELKAVSISVEPSEINLVYGGLPVEFDVTATYEDGHMENVTDKVKIANQKPLIAEISEGYITPKAVGEFSAKVSYTGKIGKTVTVDLPINVAANMVLNGDFENGATEPWTADGCVIGITDAEAYNGKYSLAVSEKSATGSSALYSINLTPGKTYNFSAKLKYNEGVDERDFSMTLHKTNWQEWGVKNGAVRSIILHIPKQKKVNGQRLRER